MLPVPLVPDGRTIRRDNQTAPADETGTRVCIPVTNSIEALHAKLRRAVRVRGHFPADEAVLKPLFLVSNLTAKERRMPAREWTAAEAQFAILFEDRFAIT